MIGATTALPEGAALLAMFPVRNGAVGTLVLYELPDEPGIVWLRHDFPGVSPWIIDWLPSLPMALRRAANYLEGTT